jgi:DNA-directed RNA polymerase specialized sigma24 family protein
MILNEIANDKELLGACKSICKNNDLYQDLFQEVFIVCVEHGEDKLNEYKKKKYLKFFLIRVALNLWQQKNGRFAKMYQHHNDEVVQLEHAYNIKEDDSYNEMIDVLFNKAIEIREAMRPLHSISHKLHYEKGITYRELEKKTGIPMKSLQVSAKTANEIIKEKLCKLQIY